MHEQAAQSTIEIDRLKAAFRNIYDTMDMVADFKSKALDSMGKTVEALSEEVKKSKTYLDRARGAQAAEGAADAAAAPSAGVIKL